MSINLSRVEARAKAKPQRDPRWHRLTQGRFVGFRKMKPGAEGTWLARAYDGEKYVYQPLGDFADAQDKDRFDRAKKAAEQWFSHLDVGGTTEAGSVKKACESFVQFLREEKTEKAAVDADGRFKRLVYEQPIAAVELPKLTSRHVASWKTHVMSKAKRGAAKNPRASFNRNATALRAALNLALRRKQVTTDVAWSEGLKPYKKDEQGNTVDRRRGLYLNVQKRRQLVKHASDEVRDLLIAMCLQPVRPGDIPAATVGDFDIENKSLHVRGKSSERIVPLGKDAFAHFKKCAKNKLPSAWLIARANGGQWKKEAWRDEIKLAASAAKLPRDTVAYTLRHSVITDLMTKGLDIFHVAKLAGTSVAMIEKHYGHLQHAHARKALNAIAL
jgi:site-specific recombinase XerC